MLRLAQCLKSSRRHRQAGCADKEVTSVHGLFLPSAEIPNHKPKNGGRFAADAGPASDWSWAVPEPLD